MEVSRSAQNGPDIDAHDHSGWIQFPFPLKEGMPNSVQVVIARSALQDIYQHGRSRTDVEVCGVLVGNTYRDSRGPFVFIEAVVRGERAQNHAAQVTFTSETWEHIHSQMEKRFPEKKILGWYHTHPGFGIFLSEMDLFIHRNFFSSPEQLAFVYDPLRKEQGMFVWQNGEVVERPFLVLEDEEVPSASKKTRTSMKAAAKDEVSEIKEKCLRIQLLSSVHTVLLILVIAVLVFNSVYQMREANRNNIGGAIEEIRKIMDSMSGAIEEIRIEIADSMSRESVERGMSTQGRNRIRQPVPRRPRVVPSRRKPLGSEGSAREPVTVPRSPGNNRSQASPAGKNTIKPEGRKGAAPRTPRGGR